jgi:hypothetical protein
VFKNEKRQDAVKSSFYFSSTKVYNIGDGVWADLPLREE